MLLMYEVYELRISEYARVCVRERAYFLLSVLKWDNIFTM